MTSAMSNDRAVKILIFNLNKFLIYSNKFKAVASVKGFNNALELVFKSKLLDQEDTVLNASNVNEKKIWKLG
eukprot:15348722-Ditylum_brightwellii.AAC.1